MRSLGGVGEKDTEQEVLLLEHDVPHQAFSQAVLSFLPKMPWSITPEVTPLAFSSLLCQWFISVKYYINMVVCGEEHGESRGLEAFDSVQRGPSGMYRHR